MALKAVVSGRVMSIYEKKYTGKDGQQRSAIVADLYIDHQVYAVSKVPLSAYTPDQIATVPVCIYQNQYGLSLVYDDEANF